MTIPLFMLLAAAALLPQASPAESLRVMSFNVRYPSADDGPDLWEKRRDFLVEVIRQQSPDLIGTQELFKIQGDYIAAHAPEYAWFGRSRRGNDQDEYMGVFYRKSRLKLIEQGDFWLSETPDTPGSQSWNMSLPRMVTWGLFDDNGRRFYFLNTHFAHRREDDAARLKSAEVIVERMKRLKPGIPIVMTGDFNAAAGGPVHEKLLATGLRDTRAMVPNPQGPEGTSHGFTGKPQRRIDWILVSKEWKATRNETLTVNREGRYPSDHFPVVAEIE